MDIVKELTEDLTATVRIRLTPSDYEGKVNEMLKKTQKTANMPGFRKGMVPAGMIRKMYGKAILFDELNKLVSESLENYIKTNQLEILGNPIPQPIRELEADWEKPLDYEFSFDLGLAPAFELTLPPKKAVPFYEIEIHDTQVQQYLDSVRKRFGTFAEQETTDEQCILYGHFEELDEAGLVKENGIKNTSTMTMEGIRDEAIKKSLLGTKKGDVTVLNPGRITGHDASEMAAMLQLKKEQAMQLQSDFNFTIESINKQEPAALNQHFFDQVFGEGTVTSEQDFMDRIKAKLSSMYLNESELKLQHDLEDVLLEEVNVSLPDNFLKRWMLTVDEKPTTAEQIEKEYPRHARGIKWRLIENKIFKDNQLDFGEEEIMNFARQLVYDQFARYGSRNIDEETIHKMAMRYLQKPENMNYVMESLTGRKVFEFLRNLVNKDIKKISYEDFIKTVTEHRH